MQGVQTLFRRVEAEHGCPDRPNWIKRKKEETEKEKEKEKEKREDEWEKIESACRRSSSLQPRLV